jgi:hypothetical protein
MPAPITRKRAGSVHGERESDDFNGLASSLVVALGASIPLPTREPRGEWICLDAETAIAEGGAGLATSTLSDDDGVVAHGAQSLRVAPRSA